MALDDFDRQLIAATQGGLPLVPRPYDAVGQQLGVSGQQVRERLAQMLESGMLTRFGPLFQIERAGGLFVLAAMAVPEERYEAVTAQVNAHPEIAHNYRRAHALNMWFVLGTETPAQCAAAIERIEAETALPVLAFPKEREFFVELKLPLHQATGAAHGA